MPSRKKPVTVEEIDMWFDLLAGCIRDSPPAQAELYTPIWRALERERAQLLEHRRIKDAAACFLNTGNKHTYTKANPMTDKEKWARARAKAMKNLREITPEEDAKITADALADPDNPPAEELFAQAGAAAAAGGDYAPGGFGCHEALHATGIVMNLVETALIDHPAIAAKPEWKQRAEQAHRALFDLYQAIGTEHL